MSTTVTVSFSSTSGLSLVLLLLINICSSPLAVLSGRCNIDDKKALLAIRAHFGPSNLPPWTNDTACCDDWFGVSCNPSFNGRVTDLEIFVHPNLSGTIPPAVGDLPFLQILTFHHLPKLTGSIPSTITKLTRLIVLEISWTSLSGPIPPFLSQLTSLTDLDLSFNHFSGSIPPSLASLPNLGALLLDHNQLTGPIPDSFGSSFPVNSPPDLYLSHNNLSGPIPASLGRPLWGTIDLSRNQLTGDATVLFGPSKPTRHIDLSRNHVLSFDLSTASFPVNLSVLDLNHNMIYGKIPAQINDLSDLGLFNVSYNRLCGEIPVGNVTAKFDQFSYFHNKCLCGTPLAPCS